MTSICSTLYFGTRIYTSKPDMHNIKGAWAIPYNYMSYCDKILKSVIQKQNEDFLGHVKSHKNTKRQ